MGEPDGPVETWTVEELARTARVYPGWPLGREAVEEMRRRLTLRLTCENGHTSALSELDCSVCPVCGASSFAVEPMEKPDA